MLPQLIATLAPLVNCVQQLPQLYKTYTTKEATDLSLQTLLLILLTNLLWFLHGFLIRDLALMLSGSISMIINGTLLVLYLVYTATADTIV